jgi:hypothetical protein
MRSIDHLLPDLEEEDQITRPKYSTFFWVSYSLFMIFIGVAIAWAFFKFVILA